MARHVDSVYTRTMQSTPTNVCLIDTPASMLGAFESHGCTVLHLAASPAPFFDIPTALDEAGFRPDLLIQFERLGPKSILTGIDSIDCPTIFWTIDPHLNAHWHSAYARLFDLTTSTQKAQIPAIRQRGAADVRWMPWHGESHPFTPWNEREHGISFVGRITSQRPARKWMVDFLLEKGKHANPAIEQNLDFPGMMQLYRNSRITPNESILGEVNFRLFEAASCGCLVLSQALGPEQEELFEPGREFDTYEHVVELDEKIAFYLNNERLAQTMGKAAHKRIQAEHMPTHRARRALGYGADATRNRATATAAKWTTLTAFALWESGLMQLQPSDLLHRLSTLEPDADVTGATLKILAAANAVAPLRKNLNSLLAGNFFADSPEFNQTASMIGLRINDISIARSFLLRHFQTQGTQPPASAESHNDILLLWAKECKKQDRLFRAGFAYNAKQHIPSTALECLLDILADAQEHLPTLRLLDTWLRPITGMEQARVGYLSILTLHERDDWRLAFEIALANLKSYRLESGIEELMLAREIAEKHGQLSSFERALNARDKSKLLAKRIS